MDIANKDTFCWEQECVFQMQNSEVRGFLLVLLVREQGVGNKGKNHAHSMLCRACIPGLSRTRVCGAGRGIGGRSLGIGMRIYRLPWGWSDSELEPKL